MSSESEREALRKAVSAAVYGDERVTLGTERLVGNLWAAGFRRSEGLEQQVIERHDLVMPIYAEVPEPSAERCPIIATVAGDPWHGCSLNSGHEGRHDFSVRVYGAYPEYGIEAPTEPQGEPPEAEAVLRGIEALPASNPIRQARDASLPQGEPSDAACSCGGALNHKWGCQRKGEPSDAWQREHGRHWWACAVNAPRTDWLGPCDCDLSRDPSLTEHPDAMRAAVGVVAEEPEWEYGYELIESDTRDVLTRSGAFESEEAAGHWAQKAHTDESDPEYPPLDVLIVRRRKAGPWVPVKQEGGA